MPKIYRFSLEFDTDYGIDKRTGWTVVINGITMTQFDPFLPRALITSLWTFYRRGLWEF